MPAHHRPLKLPLPDGLGHYETLICMWLGSDPPLLEQMRTIADGDEFLYGDSELADAIIEMLHSPLYGRPSTPDLTYVQDYLGNTAKAREARTSLTEEALYSIKDEGWARIRTALLA